MATKAYPVELSRLDGLGSVTMCGCGVVSLHMAGVTLRLEAGAFSKLEAMVTSAAEALHARQAAPNTIADVKGGSAMIQ
jgi:hypothetical protein